MELALALIVMAGILGAVVIVALPIYREQHPPVSAFPVGRLAIVHTRDGAQSFHGVLIGVYHDAIVIRSAHILPAMDPVIGDLVLPAENVGWIQADIPADLLPKE